MSRFSSTEFRRRLWAKVRRPRANVKTTCWIWMAACSKKRYEQRRPAVWYNGRTQSTARVVCALVHGPAPTARHQAGHTCPLGENELCVSPFHLEWQTPEDNQRRKHA